MTHDEALAKLDRIIKACRYVASRPMPGSFRDLLIRIADSLQEVRDALR